MVLLLFHAVGLIGLDVSGHAAFFERVSWANMLLSFLLLLWCEENTLPVRMALFTAMSFALGMVAEIVGVRTGLIFGDYHYTATLGVGVMGVPLIIGINWAMLTYATGVTVSGFDMPVWLKVLAGAALMTFCDLWLEGFAVKHHFWVWGGTGAPALRNFIGWFVVSVLAHVIFQLFLPRSRNRLAAFYLLVFVVFLLADRLYPQTP
jgi:bisanhydrobacterioruberin hydratase